MISEKVQFIKSEMIRRNSKNVLNYDITIYLELAKNMKFATVTSLESKVLTRKSFLKILNLMWYRSKKYSEIPTYIM